VQDTCTKPAGAAARRAWSSCATAISAFAELGDLASAPAGRQQDDACKASCVDWYGNARPIFLGQRVLALMGYELVEGRLLATGRRRTHRDAAQHQLCTHGARLHRGLRPTPFD
jgi:hypothetical protein